jgi:beta-glucosidase-like glycosyl hydrolase/CubicO group peptidase (beta-lactamase class C family)
VAVARGTPERWARETLARLTPAQKAAQLVAVRADGLHHHPASSDARRLDRLVRELGVGTVVVFESEVASLPQRLNALQQAAPLPLLVAADMERGMAFRIARGVVPLPYAMAVGATGSESAARFAGEVAAREGRALGVHWAFAPVADVNSNPANPIINIRSFGESPGRVGQLAAAFIRGAREGGLLTTAKHFPGHGDTAVDSHLSLATIRGDRGRLDSVELAPFRSALEAGVDAVMLGHIAAPALDPSGVPATLSQPIADQLLRGELGFEGLIVTDALEMGGLGSAWTGEATLRAIRAGADMVLLPPNPDVAVQSIVRAVAEGELSQERVDRSALRVLAAKERLGLHEDRLVDAARLSADVARPGDVASALKLAEASITLVRNAGGVLPLRAEGRLRLLHVVLSSDARDRDLRGILEEELNARGLEVEHLRLGPEISEATADEVAAAAGRATHVVVSAFARVRGAKGTADMRPSLAGLVRRLAGGPNPVVVTSFGSPYLLGQFPEVDAYLCAYGGAESSQRAAVGALFAEFPVTGRLPVGIPDLASAGEGIQLARQEMALREGTPQSAGFRPDGLEPVDRLLEAGVAARVFPGAVVAVGRRGILAHLRSFGRLDYEPGAAAARPDTIYDLASLTKVIATTTAAMILVDQGELELDRPVRAYLPAFRGDGRDAVTVQDLLAHSSGLDWWAPLYMELRGREAYLARIQQMPLVYPPGSRSLYSDLGWFLLGEIVRRVSGEELDELTRDRIFAPLGMEETCFRPREGLAPRIAPTERDPWRGRLLRGEVHDENAFALGGVAPHAGLFGTAPDLARFAQMLLNGGVYAHQRIVRRGTLEHFTTRAGVPGSTRALGWDTPSEEGSTAGALFSRRSFGHVGFTGTSIWIDPERELFLILLTNRVHPTRETQGIREVRARVADAVIRGLETDLRE